MEAEKSGTTSAPEQAMSDSWLYKITALPGSTKFPVDEDGEMTTKTAGEIATQDGPCGDCDGHPYLGAWGHTEADCNLSVDDNGDLKRCVICETNFRTRDKPKFCEQCGLAFHAKCMDASASGRCQLCTVTDSPETAPTQPTAANFETPAKPKGATRQQPVDVEADEDEAPGAPSKSMLDARARLALLRRATGGKQREAYQPQSLDARMTGKYPAMGLAGLHVTPRAVREGEPRRPRHFLTHNASRDESSRLTLTDGNIAVKDKSKDLECANIGEFETGCDRLMVHMERYNELGDDPQWMREAWTAHRARVRQFCTMHKFEDAMIYDNLVRESVELGCSTPAVMDHEAKDFAFAVATGSTAGVSVSCDACGGEHKTRSADCPKLGVRQPAKASKPAGNGNQAGEGKGNGKKKQWNSIDSGRGLEKVLGGRAEKRNGSKYLITWEGRPICRTFNQGHDCDKRNCTHQCSFCGEGHPNVKCPHGGPHGWAP